MNSLTLGLIAALCWAVHDTLVRYLSRSTPLMAALLFVLFFGMVFQAGVIVVSGAQIRVSNHALALSLASGMAFLVASVGLYYAFARGPVRLVAPIIAAFPILSIAFALADGSSITIWQSAAVLAIIAGVSIVAAQKEDATAPPIIPTISLAVLSAIGFASSFRLGQMAAEISGELPTTLIARLTAFLILALGLLLLRRLEWPGRNSIGPLIGMGILDGIALLSVVSAATLPNPEFAAVTASMFGLLTIVLAWVFLGEHMTWVRWGGVLVAFVGVGYLAI